MLFFFTRRAPGTEEGPKAGIVRRAKFNDTQQGNARRAKPPPGWFIMLLTIVSRAALSAVFIALMLWLAGTQRPFIAGILLFFPIISLPAFFFLAREGEMAKTRGMIIGGIAAIPAWLAFAGVLYWASLRFKPMTALAMSLGAWLLCACALAGMKTLIFKS